jgi:hypothetical protein
LRAASCGPQQLDWIIATSETHHDYPSLSAQLHSRLLVREDCGALDVGGACLGLLNAFAVARSLLASGQAQTIAVTADVTAYRSPGPGGRRIQGLFGGAQRFLLRRAPRTNDGAVLAVSFGCAGPVRFNDQVNDSNDGRLRVRLRAKLFPAQPSRAWKVLTAVDCAAESRWKPLSEVLPRISQILVSLRSSQNIAAFPPIFPPSRKLRQSRLVHVRRGAPRLLQAALKHRAVVRRSSSPLSGWPPLWRWLAHSRWAYQP